MDKLKALKECLVRSVVLISRSLSKSSSIAASGSSKKTTTYCAGATCNALTFLLKGACYQYRLEETGQRIIELYGDADCVVSTSI
ncbi:MAG TPA: hypothetical protein VKB19_10040 [Pedobacter sp.]|nr:hypothetical protein [Pedobacter sp.]